MQSILDFTYKQIEQIKRENNSLQTTIKILTTQMDILRNENKYIKEIMLDI